MPQLNPHNLPVETTLGRQLGRVVAVEVDPSTHQVACYRVAPKLPLANLWRGELMVAPSQVVSLTSERMVVEEAVAPLPEAGLAAVPGATA